MLTVIVIVLVSRLMSLTVIETSTIFYASEGKVEQAQ